MAAGEARGTLAGIKAHILVDMVADRDLRIKRDLNSTPWLTDIIWAAAKRGSSMPISSRSRRRSRTTTCRSSRRACRRLISSISNIPAWHTPGDTLDAVSARSLQVVGDVVLAALPQIEARFAK